MQDSRSCRLPTDLLRSNFATGTNGVIVIQQQEQEQQQETPNTNKKPDEYRSSQGVATK